MKLGEDRFVDCGDHAQHGSSKFNDDFARQVLYELRNAACDADGTVPELENPITWEEVHAAIRSIRNGKHPGPDGIPGELLRLAGLGFEAVLAQIFNEIWSSMSWPKAWRIQPLSRSSRWEIHPIPLITAAGNDG